MKMLLFFVIVLFFIFSSFKKERPIEYFSEEKISNDSCRLSKIYVDDELSEEYVYDKIGRLYRVNQFKKNEELYSYCLIKYDELGRILNTELNYVTRKEIQPSFIKVKHKKVFSYEGNSKLINKFKSYRGSNYSFGKKRNKGVRKKDMKLMQVGSCKYDSRQRLIRVDIKPAKKRNQHNTWNEIKYDENDNPIKIQFFRANEKLDTFSNTVFEYQYDKSPSLQFDFGEYTFIPRWKNNNMIYLKRKGEEYKLDCSYDERGLPSNCEGEVKYRNQTKGTIRFFEYEYMCN